MTRMLLLLAVLLAGSAQAGHWQVRPGNADTGYLLLAGPDQYWFSDALIWSRLTPLLPQDVTWVAVSRQGQSYRALAQELPERLAELSQAHGVTSWRVLSFASANLALQRALQQPGFHSRIHSVVMIDPDVLLPYSISRYQGDAKVFRQIYRRFQDHIRAGGYQERTEQRLAEIKARLVALGGPADNQSQQAHLEFRHGIAGQLARVNEVFAYYEDLEGSARLDWPDGLPLTVWDSDFEQQWLGGDDDAGLRRWQAEGKAYYQSLCQRAGNPGCYRPYPHQDHELPLTEPALLLGP
ncbi:hypothetical protein [Gallaecimonas sp. GXIMD4217]|uniref:hypothetical protein n=1 Tax=Gallaecimonas sp. GXIMD4217 TaxID=3131927 RepID=UPI00311AFDFC